MHYTQQANGTSTEVKQLLIVAFTLIIHMAVWQLNIAKNITKGKFVCMASNISITSYRYTYSN